MEPTHSSSEVPTLAQSASTWLCHAATQPLLARLDFTHQAQAKELPSSRPACVCACARACSSTDRCTSVFVPTYLEA